MLSSRINPDNNNEGESTMPGDYEAWPRAAARRAPSPSPSPPPPRPRPIVPPTSRLRQRPPRIPSPNRTRSARPPPRRATSPVQPRRPIRQRRRPRPQQRQRQRSLTPEIVIDRRHGCSSSSRGHKLFRIPLDNRPTLGLRGPPKRMLELERVRCRRRRRRRRHRSCYESDYDNPPPLSQPQANVMLANSIQNPYLAQVQSSLIASAGPPMGSVDIFSNLTEEMIQNLPKHTVHLPPIHLPGSQADANTELHTVLFPAEIINPIDGTLSVIQSNLAGNHGGIVNMHHSLSVPAQPQLTNILPTNVTPSTFLSTASAPFLQQIQNLMQQVTLTQAQSPLSSLPITSQPIPAYNPATPNSYSRANIRPTNAPNSGPYNSTFSTSSNPRQPTPNRLSNSTSYRPTNSSTFQPTGNRPMRPGNVSPYNPANITPYRPANAATFQPSGITSSNASDIGSSGYSGGLNNNSNNASQPPFSSRLNQTTPRSILRNGATNSTLNTTYTRLNPTSVSSSNNTVRKATTFV